MFPTLKDYTQTRDEMGIAMDSKAKTTRKCVIDPTNKRKYLLTGIKAQNEVL